MDSKTFDTAISMDDFTSQLCEDHLIISEQLDATVQAETALRSELVDSKIRVAILESSLALAEMRIKHARSAMARVGRIVEMEAKALLPGEEPAEALARIRGFVRDEQIAQSGKRSAAETLEFLAASVQYEAAV